MIREVLFEQLAEMEELVSPFDESVRDPLPPAARLTSLAGKRVTLGMYGGYAWLTQTNNPVTAGIELDGFHAGFSLHGVLLEGQRASLYGALDYTYQKVDHKSDAQSVVIDWAQPQAQLGVMLTLAQK